MYATFLNESDPSRAIRASVARFPYDRPADAGAMNMRDEQRDEHAAGQIMPQVRLEMTEIGWQYVLPGAERRHPPPQGWLRPDPAMDLPKRDGRFPFGQSDRPCRIEAEPEPEAIPLPFP